MRNNERMALDIEERVRLHFGLVPQPRQEIEAKPATDTKQASEAAATAEAHAQDNVDGGGNGAIKRKGKGSQARA